ncbi:MAG: hypothetical protein H7334_11060 [Ferruginibacter sp.]|nr:hypothetical protein [Ferruginibacter sp.]
MKYINKGNWLAIIVLFSFISISGYSQTLNDVFSNTGTPISYLGIEFSKTKLLDTGNPDDIKNRLYASINQLIVNGPKKYGLKEAFHKSDIGYDFGAVTQRNAQANVNEILSTNPADFNRFKESDITAIIKNLSLGNKKGVGLLFVIEAMR